MPSENVIFLSSLTDQSYLWKNSIFGDFQIQLLWLYAAACAVSRKVKFEKNCVLLSTYNDLLILLSIFWVA